MSKSMQVAYFRRSLKLIDGICGTSLAKTYTRLVSKSPDGRINWKILDDDLFDVGPTVTAEFAHIWVIQRVTRVLVVLNEKMNDENFRGKLEGMVSLAKKIENCIEAELCLNMGTASEKVRYNMFVTKAAWKKAAEALEKSIHPDFCSFPDMTVVLKRLLCLGTFATIFYIWNHEYAYLSLW